jgi:hypothetical protein
MAGSGGSEYHDSLGSAASARSGGDCATLTFEAVVMSADPAVVRRLEVGSMCEILLEGEPRQLRVYVRDTGQLLGAITERWNDLTGCIDSGFTYEAIVLSTNPTRIRVRPRTHYQLRLPFDALLVDIIQNLAPGLGDEVDLEIGPDGHPIAVTADRQTIGRIPAEPVALTEAIQSERARTARVVTLHTDSTAAITIPRP